MIHNSLTDEAYRAFLQNLYSSEQVREYTLERIHRASDFFGNPENAFKIIHIAGTNGKGSVSKMVFQMLKDAGIRVGVFTSPHIYDITERFETEKGYISREDLINYTKQLQEFPEQLSYFEKCVMLALLYFRDVGSEYVVLEAGMGGRLDATNITSPVITAITSIGYDHMEFLGDSLEAIATEKAGIIKPKVPLVLYGRNPTIEFIAREVNAPVSYPYEGKVLTNLYGKHQIRNAKLAYKIGEIIGISKENILSGLNHVSHRGRLEYILPNLLIDGAHNEESMNTLKQYIQGISKKWKNIEYIFALKKGKNPNTVFEVFPKIHAWYTLEHRSSLLESSAEIVLSTQIYGKEIQKIDTQSLHRNAFANPETLFVFFGSLYALQEVLDISGDSLCKE